MTQGTLCVFSTMKDVAQGQLFPCSTPFPPWPITAKILSRHMGTNASASVLHAWPMWHSCAFTMSHLSPTGIFTGVSSLWFSHLSNCPFIQNSVTFSITLPMIPRGEHPAPLKKEDSFDTSHLYKWPVCLGQNSTDFGHRHTFLENN